MDSKHIYKKNPKEYPYGRIKNTADFVKKANWVFGDRYDYSKTVYTCQYTPLTITCPIHGDISILPGNHLRNSGCNKCGRSAANDLTRITITEFIEKCEQRFGIGVLDFSRVILKNIKEKIKLGCNICGKEFSASPEKILVSNTPCPACRKKVHGKWKLLGMEEVLSRFKETHGDVYDYSQLNKIPYESVYQRVPIICKHHGTFEQGINHHSHGEGCPDCSRQGWLKRGLFDKSPELKNVPAVFYILHISSNGESFIKVGISRQPKERISAIRSSSGYNVVVIRTISTNYYNAYLIENHILNMFAFQKYTPNVKFGGHTECLSPLACNSVLKEVTFPAKVRI